MHTNQFSGHIPSEFGELDTLFWLDLANNALTGKIPSELSNASKNLRIIILSDNQLTGTIPSSIGDIRNLWEFWVFDNKLTGSIPSTMYNMTHLVEFLTHGNMLNGTVDAGVCDNSDIFDLIEFTADCDSGYIICDCCDRCY